MTHEISTKTPLVAKIDVKTPPVGVSVVEFIGFILEATYKESDGWKVNTIYDVNDVWGPLKGYRVFNPFKSALFSVLADEAEVKVDVRMDGDAEVSPIIDRIKSNLG